MEFLKFIGALIMTDGFFAGMCATITLLAIVQVAQGIIEIVSERREAARKRREKAERLEKLRMQKANRTFYNYELQPRKKDTVRNVARGTGMVLAAGDAEGRAS